MSTLVDTDLDILEETFTKDSYERCCDKESYGCDEPAEIMVIWSYCCGSRTRYHYCMEHFNWHKDFDGIRRAECGDCGMTVEVIHAVKL